MPVIRIEMWTGRTHAQKQELARAITEAVCAIAETTPEATTIIFEDVDRSNWSQAGVLASDEKR
jgi:4-oxalocrotonate tautomerase